MIKRYSYSQWTFILHKLWNLSEPWPCIWMATFLRQVLRASKLYSSDMTHSVLHILIGLSLFSLIDNSLSDYLRFLDMLVRYVVVQDRGKLSWTPAMLCNVISRTSNVNVERAPQRSASNHIFEAVTVEDKNLFLADVSRHFVGQKIHHFLLPQASSKPWKYQYFFLLFCSFTISAAL